MTDGISQDRVQRPALALKSHGVWVFALGIGRRYRRRQLQQIATNRRYVFTANFRGLNRVARRISRKICRCKSITQYSAISLSRLASRKCQAGSCVPVDLLIVGAGMILVTVGNVSFVCFLFVYLLVCLFVCLFVCFCLTVNKVLLNFSFLADCQRKLCIYLNFLQHVNKLSICCLSLVH